MSESSSKPASNELPLNLAEALRDLSKEERAFIHDLATPLATINLVIETLLETEGQDQERLKQLQRLVIKINTLLRTRRDILLQRSS
ncbi:MAG: hypothetical protein NDJ90_02585 [Oligoflexia bacterium]|nr:hypothetical protein [Oligoflexia bacterium]